MNLSSQQAAAEEVFLLWVAYKLSNKYDFKEFSSSLDPEAFRIFQQVHNKNFISLGGYAGTGKTTLLVSFRKRLASLVEKSREKKNQQLAVGYCSYTGKAAQILNSRLRSERLNFKQDFVGTIHSLIYEADTNDQGDILGWNLKPSLAVDLIIIDEASMVSENIWGDLLTFKVPIILVGDHGQLPPISGNLQLLKSPDLVLTKIQRQAETNPIIALAAAIRAGMTDFASLEDFVIEHDLKKDKRLKLLNSTDSDSRETMEDILMNYNNDLLVLCGYNKTRVELNSFVRGNKFDFSDEYLSPDQQSQIPRKGDRIICLKNNHRKQIFNGMLADIINIQEVGEHHYYLEAELELAHNLSDKIYRGFVAKDQFGADSTIPRNSLPPLTIDQVIEVGLEDKVQSQLKSFSSRKNSRGNAKNKKFVDLDQFDYGYALTVHKAQGSQAKTVLVFAQRFSKMSQDDWQRWLYTSVTRAQEELVLII